MARSNRKRQLGQILIEAGRVSAEQIDQVLEKHRGAGKRLGELLIEESICDEQEIAAALSSQLGVPLANLRREAIDPAIIEVFTKQFAKKHLLLPLSLRGRDLRVAMVDPIDLRAIEDAQFASGYQLIPCVTTKTDLEWAIDKYYKRFDTLDRIVQDVTSENAVELINEQEIDANEIADLRSQSEAAPIVRVVNQIISNAVNMNASDIHIEPTRASVVIRYRIDGHLRRASELPKWVQGPVSSRVKLMAQIDIAEKRVPQDGRIGVTVGGRALDLRVSTLPASYGEKLVIRILDSHSGPLSADALGMDAEMMKRFHAIISKPQGIMLVTGPTGSGKTTTLYGAIARISSIDKNITTIEDPIEYEFEGINQVGINEKAGRTFPHVLSALLRQDPDVIMVGEMRDAQTATIAMQASLTGHLVLSTIHTNDTISTITRLRNLGIPSYLIASTITGILSQRLVRSICGGCQQADDPSPERLLALGISARQAEGSQFYRGRGCDACGGTGYLGRTGIFELLVLSPRVREYVAREANESTVRQLAMAEGMSLLIQDGRRKVLAGSTTVEEVLRVVQRDEGTGIVCQHCSEIVSPEFVCCPGCGAKLIAKCEDCGMIIDHQWQFCPYCSRRQQRTGSGMRAA